MPDEKGLGSKILGVFFETDGGASKPAAEAPESAADVVAELAAQSAPGRAGAAAPAPVAKSAPAPASPSLPSPTSAVAPANVDFDAVFKGAGIDGAELDRVRKSEELLKGLPEATPVEVKKQIVETALKAFGFDTAKIVGAAQTQLKALDTFVRVNEQQTTKAIADAQAKISQLEEQIISLRVDIDKRTQGLHGVAAAAQLRKGQVHRVLDFFQPPPAPPKA